MRITWIGALALALVLAASVASVSRASSFGDYFTDKTMRIDYYHTGDASSELVALDHVYGYGTWAGSLVNLVDRLDYGEYYHKIYDAASGDLIYSRGFDSYFKEYQTSGPAAKGVRRTFQESAIVPFPKHPVVFAIDKRAKDGTLGEIFRCTIDPTDVSIILDRGPDPDVLVVKSLYNGDPHTHADVAIVGEGYTKAQEKKFRHDLARFTKVFFEQEPCRSHKKQFNVWGVWKPSAQSGIDEPRAGVYRKTAVEATFNSLGSERYVLTEDNKDLRDIAGNVPYDALYIMCNNKRYGGGGIYNLYCTFTTDNQWSNYLMVHEFGHSFFGLADEYYTSDTSYNDFYPKGYEPSEPNITALLDPKNVKWKALLTPGIEVPTPWEKADFDTMDLAWQKIRRDLNNRIAALRRAGAPQEQVRALQDEYERRDREHSDEVQAYLKKSRYAGKVGVFEGAGYASTGLYRPMVNCIMFSKGTMQFCKVCQAAMVKVIDWYSK